MITPKMSDSDWLKFFDTSYDGIIIADGKGRIVYMNPASERLEGVKKEDIIGRHAKELKDEGIYEESVTVRVLKDKKEVTITQKIGEKQLIITGVPIFKNDKIQWIFINERDITELAQLKRDYEIAKNKAEKYKRELDCLKARNNEEDKLIINSAVMEKLLTILKRVAPTDMTILIEGESGVGKDVITRWIHRHSNRSDMPFVKIDCGSLPETLLESELFGYKSGAFTGASKGGKKGLVEIADGGTLFLDEIGEVPLGLQAKLLRLLEEQVYLPVGDVKEKHVDIRIIAATNRNLKEMVDKKLFRKDLYYRLSGVPIKVPPLRQRKDDIFHFIQHFLKKYNEKYGYKKI